ncbi:hypothetical protein PAPPERLAPAPP_04470 [Brevundimonas phage vB_BpoS-Papperlapapp]|uniref:Uncharacterized protein n=2 Tax=Marchewkavirus TaxID=3425052 RepID=A0A9E7MQZ8_9CAUD|nr:hypothetical protein KABACHOK_02850 [Brevundimonas phage vB_BpoS-Kabachok]USN14816.1 hypothetical protein DOMOVOI_03420 [Brevundimonas phage vB_BpoS-Domovoi]USN16188.1 hypothetical protein PAPPERLAPAPP_04470 [Brevundimonas phage vB_BpoS-Papperlapapp]
MSDWISNLPSALHPRHKTAYAEPSTPATRAWLTNLRTRVEDAEKAIFGLAEQQGFKGFIAPDRGGWPTTFVFDEAPENPAFKRLRRKGRPMATIAKSIEGQVFETLLKAGPAHPYVDEELRQALNLPSSVRYHSDRVSGMASIAGLLDCSINWTPKRQFIFFVNPFHTYARLREQNPDADITFTGEDRSYPTPTAWRPAPGWDLLTSAKVDVIFAQARVEQEEEAA